MKRKLLIAVAFLATMTAAAQNIAAVSPNNATTIYQTLDDAIDGAESGSTIYLPGGGFQISDETKINKKLTIMGVSHRGDTDNVDGATIIGGNLYFEEGSSGSAILGVYVSGNINIGTEEIPVINVIVRYCNINSVQVKNSGCTGTLISNNYVRSESDFGNSEVTIKNNIINKICNVATGVISNNVSCHYCWGQARYGNYYRSLENINNATIIGNVFRGGDLALMSYFFSGNNCTFFNNLLIGGTIGDAPIIINASVEDLFEKWNNGSISPASNFHFKEEYKEYETQVGIYAGDGFSDEKSLAPIPRIISKKVAESTDESGKLQIVIKVKAQ